MTEVIVKGEKQTPLDISTGSSLGFDKSLLETPRSVSFIDAEQIDLLGVSTVEDLMRAVPGTYTTTRYGLQGGIMVRGIPADMYYRGMKRLSMQGHARTDLSAMDSIEVIKGPPSPIYGMGKIGGYMNLMPKSGRAADGHYLDKPSGFLQGIGGQFDRSEASGGLGGPMSIGDRKGGYYVYGLLEDSNSWIDKVGVQQRILQASTSLDNAVGPFRLETGVQWQNSITSGAYMNRVTQDLVDHGKYVSGMPLAYLDVNGDGAVGWAETHLASPITGSVSSSNRPLYQTFTWPTQSNGSYYPIGHFPKVSGIPQTMYDYLEAHPEADPTGLLRAQGAGGVLPASGTLPLGFVLDPRTTRYNSVDYHRNGSFERIQDAKLGLLFFDLVYDTDPDFTVKAQFLKDGLDSFKNSQLPYGEKQDIHVWEEKITATWRVPDEALPNWLRVNTLTSINYRQTTGLIRASGGDFDYRQDVMYRGGTYTPNTLFWNQLDDQNIETGAPKTTDRWSKFSEMGVGFMFDVDLLKKTNLVLGWRVDGSQADGHDFARFNENTSYAYYGDDGDPVYVRNDLAYQKASGWDDGVSWSASLSQQLPWGLRPYVTYAKTSTTLDAANNILDVSTIQKGHIGQAELKEAGIKAEMFGGKLSFSGAYYDQTRTDVSSADDPTLSADVSSTQTKGWEGELKFAPTKHLFVSAYGTLQQAKYIVNSDTTYQITARQLGFEDVVDADGNVVYPAEAFVYGGKTNITIPTAILSHYMDRVGFPEHQYGVNINYNFSSGLGFLIGGQWFSSTYADRLKSVKLSSSTVANVAATYDYKSMHFKVNGYNIFDERYFRAPISDTNPNLVSVMPGVRWEFTTRYDF
ncbi:MAG: TonB-dependent receptor [Solimonas sp.]